MESAAGLFGALGGTNANMTYAVKWGDVSQGSSKAAVANLGCGLDDTFSKVDNSECRGCNIDPLQM